MLQEVVERLKILISSKVLDGKKADDSTDEKESESKPEEKESNSSKRQSCHMNGIEDQEDRKRRKDEKS